MAYAISGAYCCNMSVDSRIDTETRESGAPSASNAADASRVASMTQAHRTDDAVRVVAVDGLSDQIDTVAEHAASSHQFLGRGWFAAAEKAYGGKIETLIALRGEQPVAALPITRRGAALLGLMEVAGCYWPFRSFPITADAGAAEVAALLPALAKRARVLRFGPVYDGDPALEAMKQAAKAAGWAMLDRKVADSFLLDMAALRANETWPRNSTLRKNRFHEKHLASHGALEWRFVHGAQWTAEMFDTLAAIESKSWVAARTDGSAAKFLESGHGAFWRAAAEDPKLAERMWAAVLYVGGVPAAFSFDLNAAPAKYAIANSYDPAFGKHSPGRLLYYRNLVRALDDGITLVDWGAGDAGYKRTIGAEQGPVIRDWLFIRPGVTEKIARLAGHFWRASGR